MIDIWGVLIAVVTGGVLVSTGALIAGLLVYKAKTGGLPVISQFATGDVGQSDIPDAQIYSQLLDDETSDEAAKFHTEHTDRFLREVGK